MTVSAIAAAVPPLFALSSNIWEELTDAAGLIIAALFIVAGALVGYVLRWMVGRWQADSVERSARMSAEAMKAEVESIRKEAEISARVEDARAREEFEASIASRRANQDQAEARLAAREESLDGKSLRLDARESVLKAKAEELERAAAAAEAKSAEAEERLQRVSRMTFAEARREVLKATHAALREDAESMSRRIQEAAKERGEAIARGIVADAIGRCAASCAGALSVTAVAIPGAEMKGRIVGREGRNVRAFEAHTGVSLLLDDSPDSVVLSSFDPVRREVARLALEDLIADGRIHPSSIEAAVESAKERVRASTAKAGEAAAAEAGVAGLPAETLELMGSLMYRTSFTQNVLRHSVEVALISGVMAAELGLDAAKARRIGFLHDIGKAATGERKGSHAALGAEFLRLRGEAADVCAAVAAHHGEAESPGGVYGVLCAAADAISASRPGARQESAEEYVQRLEDVEKIARRHAGVVGAMAVQSGRDLRVMVDPDSMGDDEAAALARDVCREISSTVRFPGQIRVTVIRERRCVEYAR